ncbi:ribose transport system permease protein RbsC [Peptococcaceae bacterium CEB3]|nr:ribose transport system permease protein RbsC [Peptococcaceae bacterium CEB3]
MRTPFNLNQRATRIFRSPAMIGWVLFLIGLVANAIVQPTLFKLSVINSNLGLAAPLIMVAIGQTAVVLAGGIDLSVGSIVTLTNVLVVSLYSFHHTGFWLAAIFGVAAGMAVGVVNGFIISVVRIPALLVTFAMMSIVNGVALAILPQPGGQIPADIYQIYGSTVGGLPFPFLLIVFGVLLWMIFRYRKIGRYLIAVGGADWSSRANGIPVTKVRFQSYILSATFASLAGLFLTSEVSSGDPLIGASYALNSLAAVVLGGTALAGGRGSVSGSAGGALFLILVQNIVYFANVPSYYQTLVSGLIVVIGLATTGVLYVRSGKLHLTNGR